ncbi:MAG TPA: TatD family hydrolase [Sedimentisphaerales bacterium]|nr:TatD family hydrolase [Sedimentisphaerales bacterium]
MLFDAHAHLTFDELSSQIDGVISRSIAAGVTGWVTIGTTTDENEKAVAMASRFDNMYAALGIHPHYAKDASNADIETVRKLAANPKVVAVGETGLDFHYNFSKQQAQQDIFRKELELASQLRLPVVIHSRNAYDQTIEILDEFLPKLTRVVIHCFTYSAKEAISFLDCGCWISFSGVVTFKSADACREAARVVPLSRMMVETDCPYMSPEPMRKQRVCEPALLVHTARRIAELKGMDYLVFCQEVTASTRRFFGLK